MFVAPHLIHRKNKRPKIFDFAGRPFETGALRSNIATNLNKKPLFVTYIIAEMITKFENFNLSI